jgi:hypothetical protein
VAGNLKVSLVTDEAPNCFTIDIEATGLPKFRSLLPLLGPQGRRGLPAGK